MKSSASLEEKKSEEEGVLSPEEYLKKLEALIEKANSATGSIVKVENNYYFAMHNFFTDQHKAELEVLKNQFEAVFLKNLKADSYLTWMTDAFQKKDLFALKAYFMLLHKELCKILVQGQKPTQVPVQESTQVQGRKQVQVQEPVQKSRTDPLDVIGSVALCTILTVATVTVLPMIFAAVAYYFSSDQDKTMGKSNTSVKPNDQPVTVRPSNSGFFSDFGNDTYDTIIDACDTITDSVLETTNDLYDQFRALRVKV